MITTLESNQIFVFGSNLEGKHTGGAARQAADEFGAEDGIGEGLTGKCYAFPTLEESFNYGGFRQRQKWLIEKSRDKFFSTACALPEKQFLLTKVGCGIAGYPEEEMKALFVNAPTNVILPEDWKQQ